MNSMYRLSIAGFFVISALSFCTKSNTQPTMADSFITDKNGWYICSPGFHSSFEQKKQRATSSGFVAQLIDMGAKADTAWLHATDKKEFIIAMRDIFAQVDSDFLINVIDEVLNDNLLLEQVMQASYKNATGFLKVVLIEGKEHPWKLRLHVWQEKEFPHNHKWDFYSKIISGYLRQDIYVPTTHQEDPTAQLYQVREPISLMPAREDGTPACPCRDTYALQIKGDRYPTTCMRIASSDIIGRGESYVMPYHLTHRIVPGRGAISFVFTSRTQNENSEVFIPFDRAGCDLVCNAPSVTLQELRDELLRVKQYLQQLQIRVQYLPEMIDVQHRWFNPTDRVLFATDDWRSTVACDCSLLKPVKQLTDKEKEEFIVAIDNGNITIGDQPVDNDQEYLFVLVDDIMYAAIKDFHHKAPALICHTSFSDYGPVASAGVLKFDTHGVLQVIEAYSGHYGPALEHMYAARAHLQSLGMQTDHVLCTTYYDREV